MTPGGRETARVVDAFNGAWNAHDVEGILRLMTDDCVFESKRPPPDGERIVGHAAMRSFLTAFFGRSPHARFVAEETFTASDRCVVRWRYEWSRDGVTGHVRGVDVLRVRDGKVAEKFAYVKG